MAEGYIKVVDLHTHTLFSDGELVPAELAQRARVAGYSYLGLSDHADSSNLEFCVSALVRAAKDLSKAYPGFTVIPGIELTHVPPSDIPELIAAARSLGAKYVVVHGETPVEPVEPGTNFASISGGCDILAHPGFLTQEEAKIAAKNGVFLEISARGGHSLTNGYVVQLARKNGAKMLINSDAHSIGDILTPEKQKKVALGAGLSEKEYEEILAGAYKFAEKLVKG
ncbi:MAG: histidinol phosphate phosphatase domain-containing protein [Deltaproteobacteria bacterium]|jgi:histidinol phosphatase-like PHP family hydrolase|nr:histidinol phosphate phosphatase domain-containing protein [Deltaproteobacteria bacterium]